MDAHTVASWAYKTCILADLASTRLLAALPFRWLCQRRYPPEDVVVTMASYGGCAVSTIRALDARALQGSVTPRENWTPNAYLITIGIGHLVFQVFGHHIRRAVDLAIGLEVRLLPGLGASAGLGQVAAA